MIKLNGTRRNTTNNIALYTRIMSTYQINEKICCGPIKERHFLLRIAITKLTVTTSLQQHWNIR